MFLELGLESVKSSAKEQRRSNAVAAVFGYFLIGAVLGSISARILPQQLSPNDIIAFVGLFVGLVFAGLAMHLFGDWRRRSGARTTHLATFWGGAALAFGVNTARFLFVVVW